MPSVQMSFEVFHNVVVVRAFNIAKAAHVGSTRPLVTFPSLSEILICISWHIMLLPHLTRLSSVPLCIVHPGPSLRGFATGGAITQC